MQNVNNNIQERLQILHDYIQRTIDALNDLSNSTRQVVHGLAPTATRNELGTVQGLSHTGMVNQGLNYGFIPMQLGVNPFVQNVNPFVQGMVPQVGFPMINPMAQVSGLNHTTQLGHLAQHPLQGNVPAINLVQTPYGLMQVPVTNSWLGAQNVGGLSHSTFVPGQGWVNVQGWINPALVNFGGLNHNAQLQNPMLHNQTQVVTNPAAPQAGMVGFGVNNNQV